VSGIDRVIEKLCFSIGYTLTRFNDLPMMLMKKPEKTSTTPKVLIASLTPNSEFLRANIPHKNLTIS